MEKGEANWFGKSRVPKSHFRTYSRKLENGPYVWPLSILTWKNVLDQNKVIVEDEKANNRKDEYCQK